jgi:hypothetical protein
MKSLIPFENFWRFTILVGIVTDVVAHEVASRMDLSSPRLAPYWLWALAAFASIGAGTGAATYGMLVLRIRGLRSAAIWLVAGIVQLGTQSVAGIYALIALHGVRADFVHDLEPSIAKFLGHLTTNPIIWVSAWSASLILAIGLGLFLPVQSRNPET